MASELDYINRLDLMRQIKKNDQVMSFIYDNSEVIKSSDIEPHETEVLNVIFNVISPKRTKKECYSNSQIFMLYYDNMDFGLDVRYYEGYVFLEGLDLPIAHGWLMVNGKILDLTLRQDEYNSKIESFEDLILGEIPNGYIYVGLEIPTEFILDRMNNDMVAYTVLHDYPRSIKTIEQLFK